MAEKTRSKDKGGRRHRSHSPRGKSRSSSRERRKSNSSERRRRDPPRDKSKRRSSARDAERPRRSPSRKRRFGPPFARGRQRQRWPRNLWSFSLSRSRSTSRTRSRSTSRGSSKSSDRRKRGEGGSGSRSRERGGSGFAVPPETPLPSCRLDGQLYLALSSCVALASLASSATPQRSGAESMSLALTGVGFALSLLTGAGLRHSSSRESLVRPLFPSERPAVELFSAETVINSLHLLLWATIAALSFGASDIATDELHSIWNANWYYSALTSLGLSSFLAADGVASGVRVHYGRGHNFKPAGLARNWILLGLGQVGLVAFCLQGLMDCGGGSGGYCGELITGVGIGVICAVVAAGHFVLGFLERKRSRGRKKKGDADGRVSMGALGRAFVTLVCSGVNAGFLTSSDGDEEGKSINVYFASWISFFLSLGLCLRYFDAYCSPGSLMSSVEYNNWVTRRKVAEESEKKLLKKRSTGSTKSSHSAEFQANKQIAADATAHLESMVASNDSSEPMLYLDNALNASVLSMGGADEEYGWPQEREQETPQLPPPPPPPRARNDPSRIIPQNGVDPDESVSTPSRQRTVTASTSSRRNKDPSRQGMDPVESVSSNSEIDRRATRRPILASCRTMEPAEERQAVEGSASTNSEFNRRATRRASPPEVTQAAPPRPSMHTRPKFVPPPPQPRSSRSKNPPSRDGMRMSNITKQSSRTTSVNDQSVGVQSMTAFVTTTHASALPRSFDMPSQPDVSPQSSYETSLHSSKLSPERPFRRAGTERNASVQASIISLFDEGAIGAAAQVARASLDCSSVIMEGTAAPAPQVTRASSEQSERSSVVIEGTIAPQVARASLEQSSVIMEGSTIPSSVESSPNTLGSPPTLDPSHSSKIRASLSPSMRASPSVKSGRTNRSKGSKSASKASPSFSRTHSHPSRNSKGSQGISRAHSTPSQTRSVPTASSGKSRASTKASSAAKSSITGGSKGPPTLSEDESSGPLTRSDDDEEDQVYEVDIQSQSAHGRPVYDISTDDLSMVSDPTMDGFDQSQKGGGSYRRKDSHATMESDTQEINQDGSVDIMVMLALKQAYESRQKSLRQQSGEAMSRGHSPHQGIPAHRSSSDGALNSNPQSHSHHSFERKFASSEKNVKKESRRSSGSGDMRSLRSFYSHGDDDTLGDDGSAFAC